MALRVDKKLTGLENLYNLAQYTWPEEAELLTEEHVAFENLGVVDGEGNKLQVTMVATSDAVEGSKTVVYEATNLNALEFADLEVDALEDATPVIQDFVAGLPCLTGEVVIGEAQEVEDNHFRVTVSATEGAYTVYNGLEIEVLINEYPLNLETDLEGSELDGFGQVVPVVRSVELPEGGDVVLGEGDTFQYGVNFDGDEVAALELDIIIADPADPLKSKEQFTVYADVDNPYGNEVAEAKFDAMQVSVAYAEGSWSIDFGPLVSAAMAQSGEVKIYAALRGDDKAKLWGDMMAPSAEMLRKFNISAE